jgi:hypothetical protein
MAVAKLGQASHNEITNLRQQHFDLDVELGEVLNTTSFEIKRMIVARIPQLIAEIKAEMAARENDI